MLTLPGFTHPQIVDTKMIHSLTHPQDSSPHTIKPSVLKNLEI